MGNPNRGQDKVVINIPRGKNNLVSTAASEMPRWKIDILAVRFPFELGPKPSAPKSIMKAVIVVLIGPSTEFLKIRKFLEFLKNPKILKFLKNKFFALEFYFDGPNLYDRRARWSLVRLSAVCFDIRQSIQH